MRLRVSHQQSQYWLILAHFMDYYSLFRGPRAIPTIDDPRGAFTYPSSIITLLANSDTFHGLLLTVLGPKRFPRLLNPGVRLRVSHEQSQYWLILAHFMDYYSLFLGPRAIPTIDDPRGAFTYSSSILTLLDNSDTFHGLLLAVLGSRSDFHSC